MTETGSERARQFCVITLAYEHFSRREKYGLLVLTAEQVEQCKTWAEIPECTCDLCDVAPKLTTVDLSGLSLLTTVGAHFLASCPSLTTVDLPRSMR